MRLADSLARAGAEGRLFLVDYASRASMVPGGRSLQAVAHQGG